jgi:hypothetical protein
LSSILLRVGQVLAARNRDITEYRWNQDQIGLGLEEIMRPFVFSPQEISFFVRVIYLQEKNVQDNIFVA